MKITVKLFANLRDLLPEGSSASACVLDLDDHAAVDQVLDMMKIPSDIKLIILVNGVHVGRDTVLAEGDVLAVFPPLAGG